MILKKLNKFFKLSFVYLIFFLIGDVIVSNFFINTKIENNCYKWLDNFHHLKKNCYAKEKWIKKSKSYKVFTDKNGFRFSGNEKGRYKKEKTAFFFGGSFTYGMGVSFEDSFVGLIEKSKKDYNILNLGVAGYSPTVFSYQLDELIKKEINPNKIFLVLDIIDVYNEATNWKIKENTSKPININSIPNADTSEKKFKNFKRKNFKVTRIITTSINNSLRSLRFHVSKIKKNNIKKKVNEEKKISKYTSFLYNDKIDLDKSFWQPYGLQEGLLKIERSIEKISKTAKDKNSDFYIIIYPWPDMLSHEQDKFNWELFAERICKENSCTKLISFFPEFNKIKETSNKWVDKLYIDEDIHLTKFGHNLVARKILDESF